MKKLRILLLPALLVALAIGCSDDDDGPTAPIEDPVDPPTFTTNFDGMLEQSGISCHVFTTSNAGNAEMRLTDLQPLATLTVGLGIGLDDGDDATACAFFASDQSVRVNEVLQSRLTSIADYCVCVFDVGNIFADQVVTYTLQVDHP